MSYELIIIILAAICLICTPVIGIYMFQKGYHMGVKDWNTLHPDQPKTLPDRKPRIASSETDKELKKYATLFENIENYDGTDAHQQEIK